MVAGRSNNLFHQCSCLIYCSILLIPLISFPFTLNPCLLSCSRMFNGPPPGFICTCTKPGTTADPSISRSRRLHSPFMAVYKGIAVLKAAVVPNDIAPCVTSMSASPISHQSKAASAKSRVDGFRAGRVCMPCDWVDITRRGTFLLLITDSNFPLY